MSWLAHFIHEEIYPMSLDSVESVTPEQGASAQHEKPAVKKFGVCGEPGNAAEKDLLNKILRAIHIDEEDYIFSHDISDEAENWLIFKNSHQYQGVTINSFEVKNIGNLKITGCTPLSSLIHSQNEKRKLWELLKLHYA